MKTAFKILMLIVVAACLIYAFFGLGNKTKDMVCTGMELEMRDSLQLGLINEAQVEEAIRKHKITFEGKKISDINMSDIQRKLSESPYIDTVECDLTSTGKVHLTVVPMAPVLHVMTASGEDYYLDRHGATMPVGNIKANLIIATGNITKDIAQKGLTYFANVVLQDEYWRTQIQQIEVKSTTDVRLYTRIADHTVQLGGLDELEAKLANLRTFYEKALPVTGWNKYTTIDVGYKDIVVGERDEKHVRKHVSAAPAPAPVVQEGEANNAAPANAGSTPNQ